MWRAPVDTIAGLGYRIPIPDWRIGVNLPGWKSVSGTGLLAAALASTLVAGGLGCGKMRGDGSDKDKGPDTKDTSGGTAKAETGPILIGEYGSMTGSEATFGKSTHNGLVLAIEERNAAGGVKGRKIEVKSYDDAGKTQEAGSAVTRLITQDKVVAVIGEVASSLSIAGGSVAQQYGIPMISPSSTNEQVTEIGDMIFRVCFVDGFQGYVVAKFARDNLKASKVAILYDKSAAYSDGLAAEFKKHFIEQGGTIVAEATFTKGDSDFSAQLTTIRGASPEAIFLPAYYTDVGNIALQARKLGITVPFMGGDGWDSTQLQAIGGKAIEGSYFSNHYSPDEQRPEVQDFVKKYQAKFGGVPDGLAALGYDAGRLLFEAMDRAPSLGGKDLAAAIAATKDFAGVTGKISINAKRDAEKSAAVLQVKDKGYGFVASIAPPSAAN
jgi:branched-chain amino acid transport system substrate-binding protein